MKKEQIAAYRDNPLKILPKVVPSIIFSAKKIRKKPTKKPYFYWFSRYCSRHLTHILCVVLIRGKMCTLSKIWFSYTLKTVDYAVYIHNTLKSVYEVFWESDNLFKTFLMASLLTGTSIAPQPQSGSKIIVYDRAAICMYIHRLCNLILI